MSEEIKRYDSVVLGGIDFDPTGEFVKFDDHQQAIDRLTAERDAARGEAERLHKAPEWQPIETAPKDASWIMIGRAGRNEIMLGYWHRLMNGWWGQACENGEFKQWQRATHWMPLPAAPEQSTNTPGDSEVLP